MSDDPKQVWQNLKTQGGKMSAQEIRAKAERFDKQMRLDLTGGIVAVSVLTVWALFGLATVREAPAEICAVLVVAVILGWIAVLIQHQRRSRNLPDDAPLTTCLQFYRREVQRRHDHFAKTPWLFLAIIAAAGLQYGIVIRGYNPSPLNAFLYPAILVLLAFAVVLPLWRREARKLRREIDALDAFERDES